MEIGRAIGEFFMKNLAGKRNPKVIEGKRHVACIGDSITFGAGVRGMQKETWEYILNRLIGEDYQVINYGVNGRTAQKEGDMPYVNDQIYARSLQCKAETYLIMLGTNDGKYINWIRERYERDLNELVSSYRQLDNHPTVILMTPPSCFPDKDGNVAFGINAAFVGEAAAVVRKIGEINGIQVIDLYQFTSGKPQWFTDGVHPNAEGNKAIAGYISIQFKRVD